MLKLDESRLCIERALALEPNNAQALNNLANTFKRLGLAAEAHMRWNAALALNPEYAEAYSNLSNLLNDQGEYDRAESMARRAIALSPRLADAYIIWRPSRRRATAMQTLRRCSMC
jgi:tetratricopeptide (TPR) repeat protein